MGLIPGDMGSADPRPKQVSGGVIGCSASSPVVLVSDNDEPTHSIDHSTNDDEDDDDDADKA
jgi:hypothetical protein